MIRQVALWLSGIAAFVLALELALRLLPVSTATATGYYTDPLILTYPPYHRWTTSTGWDLRNAQTLSANKQGFVSGQDFEINDRAVALIGDSFIEASMLPAQERPGEQLRRALGSRPVYAMGGPGSALLDYAERIRFAHEKFAVRDFVILMEVGDVKQSVCGSGNIHGPCIHASTLAPQVETQAPASKAKAVLRQSALAQYLVSQLKFDSQRLWSLAFGRPQHVSPATTPVVPKKAGVPDVPPPNQEAVMLAFFKRIQPFVSAGRLVIVMDSDRRALYAAEAIRPDPARLRFIELARAAGAAVIDTEPLFRSHIAQSRLKLDVGPTDGHLNALGIHIVVQAAAAQLNRP